MHMNYTDSGFKKLLKTKKENSIVTAIKLNQFHFFKCHPEQTILCFMNDKANERQQNEIVKNDCYFQFLTSTLEVIVRKRRNCCR